MANDVKTVRLNQTELRQIVHALAGAEGGWRSKAARREHPELKGEALSHAESLRALRVRLDGEVEHE